MGVHPSSLPLVSTGIPRCARNDSGSALVGVSPRSCWRARRRPDHAKHALEIAAEDSGDLRVRILPSDQSLGEVVHPLRVVKPFDVDLVAKCVRALVTRLETLVLVRRHLVVAVEIDIAADAEMLGANELSHVVELVEDILDCRWLAPFHEIPHAGDAHDAPRLADGADHVIWLASRMIR